jgi:hypothetical protein
VCRVTPGPDGLAARVAARQRGLATADQLLAAGMSRSGISRRVAAGRLRPVYRGIYLVGHPVAPPLAIELGAVLACSPDAFLSHFSGANLYALLKLTRPNVDVTVVGRNPGKHSRIAVHRVRQIDPRDVTRLGGIPTTTPARILLDLAEVAQLRQLEIAWDEAHSRKLVKAKDITALIDRSPGRRGIKRLRALQERDSGPTLTRSEAEELLLALIRRARLPAPEMNAMIGNYRMDFVGARTGSSWSSTAAITCGRAGATTTTAATRNWPMPAGA